jgi:hypothetical protein
MTIRLWFHGIFALLWFCVCVALLAWAAMVVVAWLFTALTGHPRRLPLFAPVHWLRDFQHERS